MPLRFYEYDIPRARRADTRYPGETYGRRRAAAGRASDVPADQNRFGRYLLELATAGAHTGTVKSWNSGDPARESNGSHAERFLFPWLTQALATGSLREIHVLMNLSPCAACAAGFPDLKNFPGLIARLDYTAAYEGRDREHPQIVLPNTTTQADLASLRARGWDPITGPLPAFADRDAVMREATAALRIIRTHS